MADSLVNSALMKLEGMAFGAVTLQTNVGKRALGLKDDLAWLQLLLRDADQRRRQEINEYIELWVRQTREVTFHAEDLLDEYFHEGRLHCRGVLDLPSLLRWLRRSATGLFVRQNICADIDDIKERLDQIKKKAEDNNLMLQSLPATATTDKRRKRYVDWNALSESNMDHVVGISGTLKQIEDWLNNSGDTSHPTIVTIRGKSGVGKTTLASCVYESSEVRAMFHYIIWVHVPNKFRVVDVVADMVRQTTFPGMPLDPKWKNAQDIGELTEKLTKSIGSNKYLIILDDVHSLDELKLFLSVLPKCKGSAVVITTELKPHHTASGASSIEEDKGTCWKLKTHCCHQLVLQKLEKEEAGEMFCRRVFGKSSFHNNLKNASHANMIKDLLDKSLPLAGTLLAGLLRTKKEEEWADVINQLTQQRRRLVQQTEQQEKMQKKQQQQLEEAQINQQPAAHQKEMKKKQHQQGETVKLTRQQGVQDKQPEKEKAPEQQEKMHQIEEEQEHNQQPAGQQEEMKKKQQQQEEAIQDKQPEEKNEPEQQQDQPVYRHISLVDQILMLSFDDLPPRLKQCFLYFSAFKAEEPINASKLIRLWVAEGLVRPTDGRTMEENGWDYLRTLISRCLVNLVKKDYSNNILSIRIHERILAFARSEAHEINFLQVHHSTTDLPSTAIRRLSIRNAFDPHTRLALATSKLRSLLCECPEAPDAEGSSSCCSHYISKAWEYITGRVISLNIHQCKFLRVVDLQGMVHRSTLPYEIGWLIYLQYLGLTHTGLKKLPRSIKHLRNLQTLDITDTGIKKVPKGLWKIKALRHVLAEELQNGPRKANYLPNLQTLHGVHCKDSALKKLINLRSLGLRGIDKRAGLEDCFRRMECLRSLDLAAKNGVELPLFEVLTMLGLRNLQCLKLDGKVSKLPGTTQEQSNRSSHGYLLHNLTKLEVYNSGLDQAHIDLIAEVPNLVDLILGKGSYTNEDMVIPADGFPELKKLQVNNLPLKTWRVTEDGGSALKQLQEISILNCTALTMILDHLKTLEDLVLLTVKNCPKIGKLPLKSNFQSEKNLVLRTW